MSEKLIAVTGIADPVQAGLTPEYAKLRDRVLIVTSSIEVVTSDEEAQAAIEAAQLAQGFVKDIDKQREKLKAPALEAGRLIDSIAKKAVEEVKPELDRLNGLVAKHEQAKRAAEQERLRKAREEQERLQREKEEAERRAREAKSDEERRKAAADAAAAEIAAADAEEQTKPVMPTAYEGTSISDSFDIEVTDLHALYAAHPDCVKLEAKKTQIRALVNAGKTEIPGVKINRKLQMSTRGVNPNTQLLSNAS